MSHGIWVQRALPMGYNCCNHYESVDKETMFLVICSDVQGLVKPPRVKGKGQEGKGQGKDFMTLNKPLTLQKGQGFYRGFYFSNIKVL